MNKFTLAFVALVAAAAPAYADPITAAATWLATATGIGVATAVAAVNLAVGFALNAIGTAIMGRQAIPGGETKVQFDVQMGDDQPLRFTLGDYVTAGQRKYIGSWGKNTRFITEVIEISAIPVRGLDAVWVNDETGDFVPDRRAHITPINGNIELPLGLVFEHEGWTESQTVPAGALDMGRILTNMSDDGNRITVKLVDGTQTAADPFLRYVFGSDEDYPWTANAIGTGKAYVIVTTRYDDDTLTSYPKFLFKATPLAVYDLRFDSTNGGSGAQRWDNPATWQPSTNPAVIAYNIIRGIYFGGEWVWGGKNMPAWRLPSAEWIAAANECDATVTLAEGGTEPAYRCGLEVLVSQVPADVLEEIGRAANMRFAEVGGAIKPIVGIAGTSALSFSDDSVLITEGQSFKPFYPVADTYNALSATYPEPGEGWTSKDAVQYIDAEALAADGWRYLPTSMSYPAAPYGKQVQRVMRAQMRDFRRMRTHIITLPPEAYALEPGIDTVSWTSQRNGYVNKRFLVESVSKTPGMNVVVRLREVDPSDYDWSSDFEAPISIVPPKQQTAFVQPIRGLLVEGVTLTDEANRARAAAIKVSCDGNETGVTNIQIQARVLGDTDQEIDRLARFGEPFVWYLRNVLPAVTYEVRARLISDLTPKSTWSLWYVVTTPDVRLGPLDVDVEQIKDEVREDLVSLENWANGTGDWLRGIRSEIAAVRDYLTEVDFSTFTVHGQIRQEVAAEVGTARSEYFEMIDVAASETEAVAQRVTSLTATVDGNTAAITQEQTARADGDSALAANIFIVDARVDENVASIIQEQIARADADSAIAANITTVAARVDDTEAAITQEQFARANADSALAADITTVETSLAGKASTSSVTALTGRIDTVDGELLAQADAVSQVSAQVGRVRAGGLIRMTSVAAPSGASSRVAIAAEANDGVINSQAALFLEARTDGTNQIIASADRFSIATGTGPAADRAVPFIVDGGVVYMDEARIRVGSIDELYLAGNAVTVPVGATGSTFLGNNGTPREILSLTMSVPVGVPVIILWGIEQSFGNSTDSAWDFSLRRGSTVLRERINMRARTDWPSGIYYDTGSGSATRTYSIYWSAVNDSISGRASMVALGVKR